MIVVEVDGQKATLVKGKWGGNVVLAPTLESLGEMYPFRGSEYLPDADASEAYFVMKEMVERGLAKSAEVIKNTNKPLETVDDADALY